MVFQNTKSNNKKSRVRYICPKHQDMGEQSTSTEVFLKNKGCCLYGKGELCADNNRLDGQIVYDAFINKGLIPKFSPEDYKKNNQLLPFICPVYENKGIQKNKLCNIIGKST
jgi:hypothetical protein